MQDAFNDIFNITDTPIKPKGRDGLQIQTGCLVVGARMTEAEFSAMADELNAASKAGTMPDVLFEDADGNIETGSPREKTP